MELDNSAYSAFPFKETEGSRIAASSPALTCFTASILWEIRENITGIESQKLPTV